MVGIRYSFFLEFVNHTAVQANSIYPNVFAALNQFFGRLFLILCVDADFHDCSFPGYWCIHRVSIMRS